MKALKVFRLFITVLLTGMMVLSVFAGVVRADEYKMYESLLTRELSAGMSGEDVTALQSMLCRLGYYTEGVNGNFDDATETAVTLFQTNCGLSVDGIVGKQTIQALEYVLSALPAETELQIYDVLLPVGASYTVNPMFSDNREHLVTLTSDSPLISISGLQITALAAGSAEVCAVSGYDMRRFYVSVRDPEEVELRVGDLANANNLNTGLSKRIEDLYYWSLDKSDFVLFAGDCFMDERMFLTDFYESRFRDSNCFTVALAGSNPKQWYKYITKYYWCQPSSLVISIGINDIRHGETPLTVCSELISLFDQIHLYMPGTVIYWFTLI